MYNQINIHSVFNIVIICSGVLLKNTFHGPLTITELLKDILSFLGALTARMEPEIYFTFYVRLPL